MSICLNCQSETPNPRFCGRSCATSFNNRVQPKRIGQSNCATCGNPTPRKLKFCKNCKKRNMYDITLREAIYTKHHKSSAYALVRSRARIVARKLGWKQCSHCGYNKHVEVGHIKPISDFSEDTLLSIINSPENLVPLCPNCHWEFDHNLLQISAIRVGLEPT